MIWHAKIMNQELGKSKCQPVDLDGLSCFRPTTRDAGGSPQATTPHIAALRHGNKFGMSINLDSRAASDASSHLDEDKAVVSHLLKYAQP